MRSGGMLILPFTYHIHQLNARQYRLRSPKRLPNDALMRQNLSQIPTDTLRDNIDGVMQVLEGITDHRH